MCIKYAFANNLFAFNKVNMLNCALKSKTIAKDRRMELAHGCKIVAICAIDKQQCALSIDVLYDIVVHTSLSSIIMNGMVYFCFCLSFFQQVQKAKNRRKKRNKRISKHMVLKIVIHN